ncbi:MAG: hypothetical protein HQ553_11915 [Chloroflexi bacterium]|nr:hypothetical protein [Chloroflexota bacterium]
MVNKNIMDQLKGILYQYLDDEEWGDVVHVGPEGDEMELDWLLEHIQYCHDCLPGEYCERLCLNPPKTFADVAERLIEYREYGLI